MELLSQQLIELSLGELGERLGGHLSGRAGSNRLGRAETRLLLLRSSKLLRLLLLNKLLLLHKLLRLLHKLLLLRLSKLLLLRLRDQLLLTLEELGRLLLEGLERLLLLASRHLLLLGSKSLLRGKLLRLLSKLLLGLKMGGQRINLTVLVLVARESLQSNLLQGELGGRGEGRLLGLELGRRAKLLTRLFPGNELLLLRGKLLLLLGSKLLLLLELSEVLFKGVGVKLGGQVLLGVEVGSVEHGSPGSLPLVGEGLSLGVA